MATISVLDAAGATQTLEKPNANGRSAASSSRPVVLSTEDKASLDAITTAIGGIGGGDASAANQDEQTALLTSIDAALGSPLAVTGTFYPVTQPVSGTVSVSGSVAVTGTFWQATQPVSGTVTANAGSGTFAISAASLPLPTGAATETTLAAINTKLGASLAVTGTFYQATQPISAASLPLPSGAATEATLAAQSAKLPASVGTKAASASLSVSAAGLEYETVAASQTAQAMGATGATGDYLSHIIIQPATTGAGTVTVLDNATVIYTFTTGTLADLRPIIVPFNAFSVSGAWKITTGANVSVVAFGDFS